jgi:hypothetical protein
MKTFSVAMRVSNPDCSPPRNQRLRPAQTPTAFLEIVSDYFPVFHAQSFLDKQLRFSANSALRKRIWIVTEILPRWVLCLFQTRQGHNQHGGGKKETSHASTD